MSPENDAFEGSMRWFTFSLFELILVLGPTLQCIFAGDPQPKTVRAVRTAGWAIWRSENFRVCTQSPNLSLDGLAEQCEDVKAQLNELWFAADDTPRWNEHCDVIVHATLKDYQGALGNEVGNSVGCCTLKHDKGQVVSRRLDIRADADNWKIDALPHELTHILVADHVGAAVLPLWLDEGIGVLSESTTKRRLRAVAFGDSRRRGFALPTSSLVRMQSLPGGQRNDAFYTQSAALVRLLMDRGGSEDFIRFVKQTADQGIEPALRDCYSLSGLAELNRLAQKANTEQLVTRGGTLRDLLAMSTRER